jgi:chromosome segregation ATPase
MKAGRTARVLSVVTLAVTPSVAAGALNTEQTLQGALEERARIARQRSDRVAEAAVLAEEIARAEALTGPSSRAGREVERMLRRFDGLSAQLDALDSRLLDQTSRIADLCHQFEAELASETAILSRPSGNGRGEAAARLDALEQARRRVALIPAQASSFRPPLVVEADPADTSVELSQKLALLRAERERTATQIKLLEQEILVVAGRIQTKQQLSNELDGASRTSGADLGLLRRQADALARGIHDLVVRRTELSRQRAELGPMLAGIDQRIGDLSDRLRRAQASGEVP